MTKKVLRIQLLLAFLLLGYNLSQAQYQDSYTSQGRIVLGTSSNISFTGIKIDGVSETIKTYTASLSGGYFLVDNLSASLLFQYDHTDNPQGSNSTSYNTGLSARYYLNPGIFIGSGYIISKTKGSDSSGFIPAEVGYALFLNKTLAVEPAVTLLIGAHNNEDVLVYNVGIGFGIYLN